MPDEEREEQELDLANLGVVREYNVVARTVHTVSQLVLPECISKAKIVVLCGKTDSFSRDEEQDFSFTLRVAYNTRAELSREELEKGVIGSSAGEYAQGIELSAQKWECNAVMLIHIVPPDITRRAIERLGGTVVLVNYSYDAAQTFANMQAAAEGCSIIPPFEDHPDVITGQGTVGMEIIFVSVGGGGLITVVAAYVHWVLPDVKIIGVEPVEAYAMVLSLHLDRRVELDQAGDLAGGGTVMEIDEETFHLCGKELTDGIGLASQISELERFLSSWFPP